MPMLLQILRFGFASTYTLVITGHTVLTCVYLQVHTPARLKTPEFTRGTHASDMPYAAAIMMASQTHKVSNHIYGVTTPY